MKFRARASSSAPATLASSTALVLLGFVLGYFLSYNTTLRTNSLKRDAVFSTSTSGYKLFQLTHLADVPLRHSAHTDPVTNTPIQKQQLVPAFTLAPNLAGLSVATLTPGQTVTTHAHDSMTELFFVLSGHGILKTVNTKQQQTATSTIVDGEATTEQNLQMNDFFRIPPRVRHEIVATTTKTQEPLVLLLCGITHDS